MMLQAANVSVKNPDKEVRKVLKMVRMEGTAGDKYKNCLNLFTVHARKNDYVISKTLASIVGGAVMIMAYLVGSVIGGAIADLSFDAGAAGISGIVMCLVSKALLMAVFISIFVALSVVGKQKL